MDYFHSIQDFTPEKGDLLISEPYLPDPNFERTVILLCAHDENGSFGFVLNQEAKVTFDELIPDIMDYKEKVYIGGPVQRDTLHFVHRSEDKTVGGEAVGENIYWGGDYNRVMEMINLGTIDSQNFKFFVGYSGWGAGQLEDELKAKSWFVYKKPSSEKIFELSANSLWKTVLEELGGKFKMMAKYPSDPRMN